MAKPATKESAIPVGTQFSPSVIDLPNFVKELVANSGNKAAIQEAVWRPAVRIKEKASAPTKRNKSLPIEAAVQYGLLDARHYATPLAVRLAARSGRAFYEEFARHILLNCGGLRVLEGVTQMQADDLPVTGDSLARFLTDQGFLVTEHNTAINSLRMWLAKAGIFPEKGNSLWRIDRLRREEIVPLDDEQIAILAGVKPEVHAFVRALCREDPEGWVRASIIRDAAESKEHVRIGRASLPNEVLRPLQAAGLIKFRTAGTASGKSSTLRLTPKFRKDILEPFVTTTVAHLDATVSDYYRRRPTEIFAELDSADTFKKGRALEALAIMLMRQLGLRFVGWNKRARDSTAQAEVDVVLSGLMGAVQTRWQIQCKNTPTSNVDVRDVASEIGLTPVTQATHILMLTRSGFTDQARSYARRIMQRTPISIFLLDLEYFDVIRSEPSRLFAILKLQSADIGRLQPSASLFSV